MNEGPQRSAPRAFAFSILTGSITTPIPRPYDGKAVTHGSPHVIAPTDASQSRYQKVDAEIAV
jgi:hypothetical protein